LERKGAYPAGFSLKHDKFLVDSFHVGGHTKPCYKPPTVDNPEKGRYHPSNKEFVDIKDDNAKCAEQSFKWLNTHKNIVLNLKQYQLNFFLVTMTDLHNTFREAWLKQAGHM
jgi:hypothetical protein